MRKIILASQSPRRRDLLTQMGVEFEAIPGDFEENLDNARTPEEVVMELGLGKAMTVAREHPDAIVIGSDTIVTVDDRQLGKPTDEADARETLTWLAGRSNFVTSSLAVVCLEENLQNVQAETVEVHFRPSNTETIENYLVTGDWADKAGSYGIQSGAAPLVEYFRGNYDTIVGLPTQLLAPLLQELGYVQARPIVLDAPVEKHG